MRKFDRPRYRGLGLLRMFLAILLLLLFSCACGGKKTHVKRPLPRPLPPPAGKKMETATKPAQKPPPVREEPPAPVIAEPEKPLEATAPTTPESTPAGPFIRIGLTTTAKEVRITSDSDYYLMDKRPEAVQLVIKGEILIRVEREGAETTSSYQVQVASYANRENAEDSRKTLEETLKLTVNVRENPATGTNQVRVGDFRKKEEAQDYLKKLNQLGYRDAFVVKDDIENGGGKSVLALRGAEGLFRVGRSGFLIQPSSATAFLCVNGKPYRGLLDAFLNKNGAITVVNQLGTEDYLLGVVPAEISPTSYPDFAALEAQAIAARTYALKNMGRYRSDGFDLSDDTSSQVYKGVSVEKDATNEAVHKTSGLAIYYQNKLIDAMYMSTCGGRTEDFSNVFDAAPVPYLKSVFCAVESGPEKGAVFLEGRHKLDQPILSDDGSLANRNIEFARVLGLLKLDGDESREYLENPGKSEEIIRWIETARKLARRSQSDDRPSPVDVEKRYGFLKYAAESFFGTAEIRRKLSTRDLDYYMSNLKDGKSVPAAARYALSYLMQAGLWRPNSDNTVRPDDPIRRSEAIFLLQNWIETSRPDILQKGIFVTPGSPNAEDSSDLAIRVKKGNRTNEYRLAEELPLFRLDPGRTTPVDSLKIIGNEKVSFHSGDSGSIDFLEIELSPNGASSDRYSPVANWEATITRSVIAEKLRSLLDNIGQFRDMKPSRIGNSGRVTQMQVIGSRRSVLVNGYKLRGALGLKDTLFTITRELNSDGSVVSFTFHGRGWGHGVGLCQVGAFGLARAGHGYEEIIKTYYQGVEIQKAY